jgi:REP element-mobilizing transposase RayT
MEIYDPRKHHRRSTRLPGYDYAQPGYYFVTFCVHGRECVLGEVIHDTVDLSSWGAVVREVLDTTQQCFWNVSIDESVVMPNHGHVIYVIQQWTTAMDQALTEEAQARAEIDAAATDSLVKSLVRRPTLGQIVAYHKYETTKRINALRNMTGVRFWQRGFYDHIVRSQRELDAIRLYTVNNPLEWTLDRDNPHNARAQGPDTGMRP